MRYATATARDDLHSPDARRRACYNLGMRVFVIGLTLCSFVGCEFPLDGDPGEDENKGEGEGEKKGEGEGDPPLPVVLNEVACTGGDFAEIMNVGAAPVRLEDLRLTDNVADTSRGQPLPMSVLEAGALLSVELTDVGLRCGEETLSLVNGEGRVLDALSPVASTGATFGRLPDGSGAPVPTLPTPGAPNIPWADPADRVFAPFDSPVVLELSVPLAAQQALESSPRDYVEAQFRVADDAAPISVGVRLKGMWGSFRGCPFSCSDKSALKLDFNRFVAGQSYGGLEKLNLNNQVQDPARTSEWLAYEIFRRQGVPAPRVGFAEVRVNGVSWGLYALVEDRDDPFLARSFPSTLGLYEGEYGQDLFPGSEDGFDVDEGDPTDRSPLVRLTTAIDTAPRGEGFFQALDPLLDWNEVLSCMATEVFIGHWDGYAPARNNYFLHVDADGVWRLLPWGADQTFVERWPLYEGSGILLQRCLQDSACVAAWTAALDAVATDVAAMDHRAQVRTLAAHLQPFHAADPRREYGAHSLDTYAVAAADFLDARVLEVREAVSCQTDPGADSDGDGAACALDCLEGDPAVHVGGDDSCPNGAGDGLDNDCNGRVDDGPGCPDCDVRAAGALDVAVCRNPRTWHEATEHCATLGGQLVTLADEQQQRAVYDAVLAILGPVDFWIGLSDLDTEGAYVWTDGTSLTFSSFHDGEPNDFGGDEDCVHARGDGLWNDVHCSAALASVCALP